MYKLSKKQLPIKQTFIPEHNQKYVMAVCNVCDYDRTRKFARVTLGTRSRRKVFVASLQIWEHFLLWGSLIYTGIKRLHRSKTTLTRTNEMWQQPTTTRAKSRSKRRAAQLQIPGRWLIQLNRTILWWDWKRQILTASILAISAK